MSWRNDPENLSRGGHSSSSSGFRKRSKEHGQNNESGDVRNNSEKPIRGRRGHASGGDVRNNSDKPIRGRRGYASGGHDQNVVGDESNAGEEFNSIGAEADNNASSYVKKVNPVYEHFSKKAAAQIESYKNMDEDQRKQRLANNSGIRCNKSIRDIFPDVNVRDEAMRARPFEKTCVVTIPLNAVDFIEDAQDAPVSETLFAIYTRTDDPLRSIRRGTPDELTRLSILCPDLMWQLYSKPLRIRDDASDGPVRMFKLFATTSFLLPSVKTAPMNDTTYDFSMCVMSTLTAVENFLENRIDTPVEMASLMLSKLSTPFLMALRLNETRKKLAQKSGQNFPLVTHIVIGDLGIRSNEPGLNSLFCIKLQQVLKTFDGCFQSVTVCIPDFSTRLFYNTKKWIEDTR
jgi:hypothetical protein